MPLAAHATLSQGVLSINAAWGDHLKMDSQLIHAKDQCEINLDNPSSYASAVHNASALGVLVANKLIAQGARV